MHDGISKCAEHVIQLRVDRGEQRGQEVDVKERGDVEERVEVAFRYAGHEILLLQLLLDFSAAVEEEGRLGHDDHGITVRV